jgi:hypothetical protein
LKKKQCIAAINFHMRSEQILIRNNNNNNNNNNRHPFEKHAVTPLIKKMTHFSRTLIFIIMFIGHVHYLEADEYSVHIQPSFFINFKIILLYASSFHGILCFRLCKYNSESNFHSFRACYMTNSPSSLDDPRNVWRTA